MSVLTSLGILISAMLIMAFLQFIPGVFALLCHQTYGKFSKLRASDLAIFFILGVETTIVLIALIVYILIFSFLSVFLSTEVLSWLGTCISLILGIAFFCCYFRKGEGTQLFIPRRTSSKFLDNINSVKTRSDAFILGIVSVLPEAVFTLPLIIISVAQIDTLGSTPIARAFLLILLAFLTVLPLLIMHALFGNGHNLADFMRFRFKNKTFFRWAITLLYIILAILFIMEALS